MLRNGRCLALGVRTLQELSKTGPLGSAVELILMHGDHRLCSVPELIPMDPSD